MRAIDLLHLDRPRAIAAFLDGETLIDCGPASTLPTLLAALGDRPPAALLLTHIHLDHAAGAGGRVARWPELPVYVHERGARHLADPSRLLASAERLYGPELERLWGRMESVPASNLRPLRGGETLPGGYEVAYTPGHASHHVSFRRGDTAFVGDLAGVRIVPGAVVIPPTPPPDIDLEAWHHSVARIRAWAPARLALTHFGEVGDPVAVLDEFEARLDAWGERARVHDRDRFVAITAAELRARDAPAQAAIYGSPERLREYHDGLARYWSRRAGALSSP